MNQSGWNAPERNGTADTTLQNPDRGSDSRRRLSGFIGHSSRNDRAPDSQRATPESNPDRPLSFAELLAVVLLGLLLVVAIELFAPGCCR